MPLGLSKADLNFAKSELRYTSYFEHILLKNNKTSIFYVVKEESDMNKENMSYAVSFYDDIKDDDTGKVIGKVERPAEIADAIDSGQEQLTAEEALRRGYDLSKAVDSEGERLITNEQIEIMEASLAQGIQVASNGITIKIPTADCRMQAFVAERLGLQPAVVEYDVREFAIQPQPMPSVESSVVAVEDAMESVRTPVVREVKTLPAIEGTSEVYYGGEVVKRKDPSAFKNEVDADEKLAVAILEYLETSYMIRLWQGRVYIFDQARRYYRAVTDDDLCFLINVEFGEKIKKNGSPYPYKSAIRFLKTEASLRIEDDYKIPAHYMVFKNGILDTLTGEMLQNKGDYFTTNCIDANYFGDNTPLCPTMDTFFAQVAGDDPMVIELLWETLGYLLSHDLNAKVFFVFCGVKDSGKSLLANFIVALLGEDAISNLSLNNFGDRFSPAELNGKHLNLCMDLPSTVISAEAMGKLKSYTGGDRIRSDRKGITAVSFYPTAHLLFGSNYKLSLAIKDDAFKDRIVQVPFRYPVPKKNQNPYLLNQLLAERDGVVAKAVEAYKRLKGNHYVFPAVTSYDIEELDLSKVLQRFISEKLVVTELGNDIVSVGDINRTFVDFCDLYDICSDMSLGAFSKKLRTVLPEGCKFEKKRIDGGGPVSCIIGIKLKS